MLKVIRHEILKDGTGNITAIVIGITYKNDITGREVYRDTVFPASDFSATPTRLEVKEKIKQWLNAIQAETGRSILQLIKEETDRTLETIITLKEGQPASLVGNVIEETI